MEANDKSAGNTAHAQVFLCFQSVHIIGLPGLDLRHILEKKKLFQDG